MTPIARTKVLRAIKKSHVLVIIILQDLLEHGQSVCLIKMKIQKLCKFLPAKKKIVVLEKDIGGWIVTTLLKIWWMEGTEET